MIRQFSETHLQNLSDGHKGLPKLGGHELTLEDCSKGGRAHLGDLSGQTFGHLLVLREGPRKSKISNSPAPHWLCLCTLCGKEKPVAAAALKSGKVISCGCKKTQEYHKRAGITCPYHNLPKQLRKNGGGNYCWKCYTCVLWDAARSRAKEFNLLFTIQRADVCIPETCPVLGIPLMPWAGLKSPNCPTLDRIIPLLGYIPGNISVISFRANRLKGDATEKELEQVLSYIANKRAKHAVL